MDRRSLISSIGGANPAFAFMDGRGAGGRI
jgi:hypothetical protein